MRERKGQTKRRKACRITALFGLTILAACVTTPSGGGRYVDKPEEWERVDLAEADLNLPLVAPLEIASLERRVDSGSEREEIYTFRGMEGYVKTTRKIFGIYPEAYARSLRAGHPRSTSYIAGLSLPSAEGINAPFPRAFLNGKSHAGKNLSRGFTAEGAALPHYTHCFVSRVAYLFVKLEAAERSDDAVDTVVEALLCGNRSRNLPRHTDLVQMMARIDAVTNRDAFRDALSQPSAGAS
jgi:hypothetical protein